MSAINIKGRTARPCKGCYSEALFKTLKYRPGFPANGFATIDEARDWVQGFVGWYNVEHRHSMLRYVTPEQRHNGEANHILAHRKQVIICMYFRPPRRRARRRPVTVPAADPVPGGYAGH